MRHLRLAHAARRMGICIFACSLSLAHRAHAADALWTGNGATSLWSVPDNWDLHAAPPDGANVAFGSGFTSGQTIDIVSDRHVGNLTIDTSSPINITSTSAVSTLYFNDLIRSAGSTGTQTISAPIGVSGNQSWAIGGTGGMAITGPISSAGASRINVSVGSLTLGAPGVQSDMYHLGIVSGAAALNGGKLTLHSIDLDPAFVALRVGGLNNPANFTVQNGATLASGPNTTGFIESSMTVTGTGSQWQFPFQTYVGVLQSGALTVQSGGALMPSAGGSFLVAGFNAPGTITVKSGASLNTTASIISYLAGAPSSASITGVGSKWNCSTRLDLGGYEDPDGALTGIIGNLITGDTATLNISDHANLTTPLTRVWTSSSSITINGGSLNTGLLQGVGSLNLQADPAGGSALNISSNDPNASLTFTGKITGNGTIHKTGASKQVISNDDTYGGAIIDGGTLAITSNQQMGTLTIAGTAKAPTARLQFGSALLILENSINGTPTSDTNKDALLVVRDLVKAGYAGGTHTGNGFQSAYAYENGGKYKLGYERMIDRKNDGAPIDPNLPLGILLVANFLDGDATMDTQVNFADLVKVAQNYGGSNKFWNDGDFNYDGVVGFADLVSVAQHYGGGLPSEPVPGASAQFETDMARAFASVPEPGSLGLIGLTFSFLARRRR